MNQPQIVIKSWHVEAIPDDGTEDSKPRKCSPDYHVRDAADQFAALMRKSSRYPQSVAVVARRGVDGIGQ